MASKPKHAEVTFVTGGSRFWQAMEPFMELTTAVARRDDRISRLARVVFRGSCGF